MSPFDYLKVAAGVIIGAALAAGPAYLYGHSRGEASAHTAALEKTVEVLQERELTNAEISASDAAALCAHFGLQGDDLAECVRRVGQAHPDAGDGHLRDDE